MEIKFPFALLCLCKCLLGSEEKTLDLKLPLCIFRDSSTVTVSVQTDTILRQVSEGNNLKDLSQLKNKDSHYIAATYVFFTWKM